MKTLALAGAVSGGGGGTTNPHPANPDSIVYSVKNYSAKIITTWFNIREAVFNRLDPEKKKASPYYKIFQSDKNIFELIKSTEAELRMSRPCLDAQGLERDGSIYASKPQAICISPFTMAPKLSEYNYTQETLALIIHELTHLMGADEEEAESIQQDAIYDFNKMDFMDVIVNIDLLSGKYSKGDISMLIEEMKWAVQWPDMLNLDEFNRWSHSLLNIKNAVEYNHSDKINFLRDSQYKLLTPQFSKLTAVELYVGANDSNQSNEMKNYYLQKLNLGFGTDLIVTAKQFESRLTKLDPKNFGPEFEQTLLHRVTNTQIISSEMADIENYLTEINKTLVNLSNMETAFYLTP